MNEAYFMMPSATLTERSSTTTTTATTTLPTTNHSGCRLFAISDLHTTTTTTSTSSMSGEQPPHSQHQARLHHNNPHARPHVRLSGGKRVVPFFDAGLLVRNRFRIHHLIGSGGFGQIFRAVDRTTGRCFALKTCEAVDDGNRLIIEQRVMVKLNGTPHMPFMVASGSLQLAMHTNRLHYIIMELLGQNLTMLRKANVPWRRFSVVTALRVGAQCVEGIEAIHNIGYLHRDIKPSNMCIGLPQWGKQRIIYLIDFGMARKFVQPDGELRLERSRAAFRGTTRYVSMTVHERKETGPVDDLWALYYSIIELAEGSLPWRMIFKQKDVELAKRRARFTELCKRLPAQFYQFEKYLKTLSWSDTPDYNFLKTLLTDCLPSNLGEEMLFEWENTKNKARQQA